MPRDLKASLLCMCTYCNDEAEQQQSMHARNQLSRPPQVLSKEDGTVFALFRGLVYEPPPNRVVFVSVGVWLWKR